MKLPSQTTAGIRTSCFTKIVLFLTQALNLEIVHQDKEKESAQFKLPSGEILEVFGSKNLWHCFTTVPDWEIIIADVRHRKARVAGGAEGTKVIVKDPVNLPNDSAEKSANENTYPK